MFDEHRVAIVLDAQFGEKVVLLAQRSHVWLVVSPANERATRVYLQLPLPVPEDPLEGGITLFDAQGASADEALLAVMGDVDEHHGEHAHDPPWTVIDVYGAPDLHRLREELLEYGIKQLEATTYGFQMRR